MIKTTEYSIATKIPQALTFGFVSDLHGCANGLVLDILRKEKPDAILVGGDFIHDNRIYEDGFRFMQQASALAPTFCALGNHELRFRGDIRGRIAQTGAVLLDSTHVVFGGIRIGGIGACRASQEEPDIRWLEAYSRERGYKLLLCHRPEYYEKYIRDKDIDLILSGHAHGGQWRFFGRGMYAPGQGIFPKYTSGLYDGRLLVGRGLGNPQIIPRICNAPEVLIIRLT